MRTRKFPVKRPKDWSALASLLPLICLRTSFSSHFPWSLTRVSFYHVSSPLDDLKKTPTSIVTFKFSRLFLTEPSEANGDVLGRRQHTGSCGVLL